VLGQTLGNYAIERELGRGGMGAVYLARHQLLGRTAALKVLLPRFSRDRDIVQRFFNEARAATAIHHPGIVEIFDFGFAPDGVAFIVMELCEGESLAARLRRLRVLSTDAALGITRQIAGALDAAHAAHIVHRDLKPDNIFLVPDPDVAGGERIKLLDFGIAKLVTEEDVPSLTRTGALMGTPYYMSPEQCRGAGRVDHRSDLYALGCILFEMLCGRVPFLGEGAGDIISSHLLIAPPAMRTLVPALTDDVEQLVGALLAKRPDDRPARADVVVTVIHRLLGTLPPPGGAGPRDAITRPQDAIAATLPAAAPVATTLGGAASELAVRPGRARIWVGVGLGVAGLAAIAIAIGVQLTGTSSPAPRPAGEPPVAAATPGDAPRAIDAAVVAPPDAAMLPTAPPLGPDEPRVVLGPMGGDAITDEIRVAMRRDLAAAITASTPLIRVVLAPTGIELRARATTRSTSMARSSSSTRASARSRARSASRSGRSPTRSCSPSSTAAPRWRSRRSRSRT